MPQLCSYVCAGIKLSLQFLQVMVDKTGAVYTASVVFVLC